MLLAIGEQIVLQTEFIGLLTQYFTQYFLVLSVVLGYTLLTLYFYTLIDTKKKLIYVGEASNLITRLRRKHPSIPHWDYFRYNVLPDEIAPHRTALERMIIRDLASLLDNKEGVASIKISGYKLVNTRVDSK